MEELHAALKVALADTFIMYYRAQSFHWNVVGPNFPQLHDFFGNLYEELHGAVDPMAEHIRAVKAFAPVSLARLKELATIEEGDNNIPTAEAMIGILLSDNGKVMTSVKKAFELADAAGEDGLANFLQDRLDVHAKHGWMLRATGNIIP